MFAINKIMKKNTLSIAICLLFILTGCSHQQANQNKKTDVKIDAEKNQITNFQEQGEKIKKIQTQASNSSIYKNEEYGFQITLTDNWRNYTTIPMMGKIILKDGDIFGIEFCIPLSADSHMRTKMPGYECLFKISMLNIRENEEYQKRVDLCEKEQKETGRAMHLCNSEIGRSNEYIFLGNIIVQDSSDEGAVALRDVEKIFSSFQVIKK